MHLIENRATNLAARRIPESHLAGARRLLAHWPHLSPTVYGYGGRQGAETRRKAGLKGHVGCGFGPAEESARNVRELTSLAPYHEARMRKVTGSAPVTDETWVRR